LLSRARLAARSLEAVVKFSASPRLARPRPRARAQGVVAEALFVLSNAAVQVAAI
jgi:hypothetical protein